MRKLFTRIRTNIEDTCIKKTRILKTKITIIKMILFGKDLVKNSEIETKPNKLDTT